MDEDMILPDGFESTPQDTEVTDQIETQEIPAGTEAQPQATEQADQSEPSPQLLKVKYNKEEKEIPIDEAIPLVQKGLNYDKVQERLQALESDPRLNFVEQMAQQYGMTADEYIQEVQKQQEEQMLNELIQQGISEEFAQEMLENRRFREQYEAEKRAKEEEEQQNQQYMEFFDYFRDANGRDFVTNQDEIPEEVWEIANTGVPLKYAYMQHENTQLRQQLQTHKQNETNAQKAPVGGTTAHGGTDVSSEDLFLQGFNSI